jgi:hypothetical protein
MTETVATKSKPTSSRKVELGRLLVLELNAGRIH